MALLLQFGVAKAQWVTFDPTNLAQGIINTTKQVFETATTASRMLSNFQETVKIYEQSKKFYDALRSVTDLVKDARKVQLTILMVGEISDIYVNSFNLMMTDKNFTVQELSSIAFGYTKLLEEGSHELKELKDVVSVTNLSMSDKERMDVIDRIYNSVMRYRNLTAYYTRKNVSISYVRSRKSGDSERVRALYGNSNERYY